MRTWRILAIACLLLAFAGPSRATPTYTTFIPLVAREAQLQTAHIRLRFVNGTASPVGVSVTLSDCTRRVIAQGVTDEVGYAALVFPSVEIVRLQMQSRAMVDFDADLARTAELLDVTIVYDLERADWVAVTSTWPQTACQR